MLPALATHRVPSQAIPPPRDLPETKCVSERSTSARSVFQTPPSSYSAQLVEFCVHGSSAVS